MGATLHWAESNGVGESETLDISNINFGNADSPNIVVANNRIVRPNNSYSKYIRIKFTGTWTDITNMKFWKSAGSYLTDEVIKAIANVAYSTPSESATGDSAIPTSEGAALSVNSAEGENHIEYGASGVSGYTAYIRLQLQMSSSTPPGSVNQKTFTFQRDET